MKHLFYICQNVQETPGFERILNFYNIIALEKTDAVDDFSYTGSNIFVSTDLTSPDTKNFVDNLSYTEKPYIISSVPQATIKLSQLYDWNFINHNEVNSSGNVVGDFLIRFDVHKHGEKITFGNIHKYLIKDLGHYFLEILDWTHEEFISKVNEVVAKLTDLKDGFNCVECSIDENGELKIVNIHENSFSNGIFLFTNEQIINNESPLQLLEFYEDVNAEDPLSFHEDFKVSMPESQTKPYDLTLVNIKSKSETVIKNDMPSGVWKYGGDNTGKIMHECITIYRIDEEGDKTLCLLHRGYSLYDVVDKEGFVISTREKNTPIKTSETIASLKVPYKVIDSQNNLFGWANEVVNAILHYQMR